MEGDIPLLQFLIVLSHVSVDKLNIATCNTFKSDAGNSMKPLEAFASYKMDNSFLKYWYLDKVDH